MDIERTYSLDEFPQPEPPKPTRRPPATKRNRRAKLSKKNRQTIELAADIPEGERNGRLFDLACDYAGNGIDRDSVEDKLLEQFTGAGLSREEVLRTLDSAYSKERDPAIPAIPSRLTEMGFGERMAATCAERLRFNTQYGWLAWTGTHWRRDDIGAAETLAKDTVRSAYAELANLDDAARTSAFRALRGLERANSVRGILKQAESESALRVSTDKLDQKNYLFNCLNGTFDLGTHTFRKHRQSDLLTKCADVVYDPEATAPRWLRFLQEILGGDDSLIAFMQRTIGYTLTGETGEQCLFLLHGCGANGKSTLLGVLQAMLGDYATQASAETFMAKRGDIVRNDIARLAGVRCVAAIESEEGRRLAESLVKQLTGQDRIVARFLFREHFEFSPEFKLYLAANHKPTIRGQDLAIWRRIRLVPFDVVIPEDQRDPRLPETLKGELPGILNWAIEGCRAWQDGGLAAPDVVKAATGEYKNEQDIVAQFIADACEVASHVKTSSKALYDTYRQWAGERPMSRTAFGRRLTDRGFSKGKVTGQRGWLGIQAREETA
ncbi:MAG: primase C-terminal domain-containing protein [Phycisphaerales bacterium]|nr:MAG: primase C-terminal domain-containing protein [Phycisphaerales bacterium]